MISTQTSGGTSGEIYLILLGHIPQGENGILFISPYIKIECLNVLYSPFSMNPSHKPPSSITLYRGFPDSGQYTWSPFVTKLETRFRFAGINYRVEAGSPLKAPRGKIPYIAV